MMKSPFTVLRFKEPKRGKGEPPEQGARLLGRLIDLKLKLDAAKVIYGEYDRTLEKVLKMHRIPTQVKHKGSNWFLTVTDAYQKKNTAWKSVAQRRFDVVVSKGSKT